MKIKTNLRLGSATLFLSFALLGCHELGTGDMMSDPSQRNPLVGDHNDHHGKGDTRGNAGSGQDSCLAGSRQDSCLMDMKGMHDMMHSGGGGMNDMHSGGGGMHETGMHDDSCQAGMTMHGVDSCKKK